MKDNEKKFTLPMLEAPRTVRVRFCKKGNLQYISHLDLQRSFSRILVRAGLPLWYTKGFNPHIKMVFGMPLPVGCESECEFLDIRIEREMSCEEIKERLNAELTSELQALEVYPAERKFSEIAFATYEYTFHTPNASEALVQSIQQVLSQRPLTVVKRSKSGEREVDILDYFKSVTVEQGETLMLKVMLRAGEGSLNPEMIVTALREQLGLLASAEESYTIMRTGVYFEDGREFE
jgi:radical SAM-linked protein